MNTKSKLYQASLPGLCPVTEASEHLANSGTVEGRGAIFTRQEVVDFMLDLVGYTDDAPLLEQSLLEPSFGGGDFLRAAIARLLRARNRRIAEGSPAPHLDNCIRAVELHRQTFTKTRSAIKTQLRSAGITDDEAEHLLSRWLIQGDFLLAPLQANFDWVVGNPPYVRQELVPDALLQEYRKRFSTLYDRADLYVPFIERSLTLLREAGRLGFICADRWTKNRYGGPLRAMVAKDFHLQAYVDMTGTPAFHSEVMAYPAITIIAKQPGGATLVAERPSLAPEHLRQLAADLRATGHALAQGVHRVDCVAKGDAPWVLHEASTTDLIRRIEADYPSIEQAGCKIGIGVATGADKVFIGDYAAMDVEDDRKLPLATTADLRSGQVTWQGKGVINPFTNEGSLVDLSQYPRLAKYLESQRPTIAARHVAKRDPARWYRTIDRITPALARQPKLLIPDIKGSALVAYEDGTLYPHHNLYYIVADQWDLRALQAVLLSSLTRLFIASYSTKMRGGFLRFQAQYLRRLRLPAWEQVPQELRDKLTQSALTLDIAGCNAATALLYGLSESERETLEAQSS